ncbi:MAG TPA: sialidase family protein [Candidatus Angelobacter sp.]|nr:sialidase family protein [Candidatus Angelobacter sp.]
MRSSRPRVAVAAAIAAVAAFSLATVPSTRAATDPVTFSPPSFVDNVKAGGEPSVIHSSKFGTLVYSSHEGTTHIDRAGLLGQSALQFACPDPTSGTCYQNHVWIWTSDDKGKTWQLRSEAISDTGFSDPDLTEDASGAIYDTGIDLANDALFSSMDGGKTWPNGTAQCHAGDRPWLAGGVPGEVFLTTDDEQMGHILLHSSSFGSACDSTVLADNGSFGSSGGTYSGFGKGVYDKTDGSFIEPAQFKDSNGNLIGFGYSRLARAADAFNGGGETFQPVMTSPSTTGIFSPFGVPQVISLDSADNMYFAWDSDERDPNGTGGCGAIPNSSNPGGPTPLPNHIWLVVGKHRGSGQWDFQPPISLAHQGNARVLWPWSVAGTDGNLSVVWYQMDKMVDPDCDVYNGSAVPDVNTFIYEAHISNALDPATRQITVTNASGRAIHQGGICDSGTTCVASGQDRRLGDYFTNSVDGNGCVIIASGDTTVPDAVTGQPRATSLPIFIQQSGGPSLTGGTCGTTTTTTTTPTVAPQSTPGAAAPSAVGIPNTGAPPSAAPAAGAAAATLATTALLLVRRRRRHDRR